MKALRFLFLVGVIGFWGTVARGQSSPASGPKNDQGLTAAIVVNKGSYVLNAAQSGKAFRDQLAGGRNGRGAARLPQPPAVDLTMRITNTTDNPVTIKVGGDDSQMNLKLEGAGAVTVDNLVAMTTDYRMGNPVTIAPGKSYDIKISSLAFGMRGISKYAYWTEAGDYTLTASYTYGVGEKQGTVRSAPVTLKVTKG